MGQAESLLCDAGSHSDSLTASPHLTLRASR